MNILLRMAWLNIWRNKRRGLILMCAMASGLVGVLASVAFVNGWLAEMIRNSVQTYEGHVKVVATGYEDNPVVENSIVPLPGLPAALDRDPRVQAWAERVRVQGMVSTANRSMVAFIIGIDPDREQHVSILKEAVREGAWLRAGDRNGILLGMRLAAKLKVGVGKKVVLMSQQLGGDIGSGAYRVGGLFNTGNAAFDETTVYILKPEAQAMLNLGDRITETTILLHDIGQSDAVASDLAREFAGQHVEALTWQQLLPLIRDTLEMTDRFVIPYYAVFYIAMAFGILNTLLMAIGERTHEIGVLLAIGMTRRRVISVILLESFLLSLVASVVGLALGGAIVHHYQVHGVDLSSFAAGADFLGVAHVVYPYLTVEGVAWAIAVALVVSVMVSLIPAARAACLKPVKALRTLT